MNDYSKSIILIPSLNEKENLKDLIPQIFNLMSEISVLIVDDSSSDGTQELIKLMKADHGNLFFLDRKDRFGYGLSSIDGFRWIFSKEYEHLVTMDADFSHDFNDIPILIDGLYNYDVVVGSRYVEGGGIKNWNLFRRILSRFANLYVKIILGLSVADVTSGFNAYRVNSFKKINLEEISSNGYAFLVELKYRLFKVGCRFVEYPIIFSERREGQSKMSSKIIWESALLPWKLKK